MAEHAGGRRVISIVAQITKDKRDSRQSLLPRLSGNNVPGHTTRAPSVGFELTTNGIQFYAIANLYKTSLFMSSPVRAEGYDTPAGLSRRLSSVGMQA